MYCRHKYKCKTIIFSEENIEDLSNPESDKDFLKWHRKHKQEEKKF